MRGHHICARYQRKKNMRLARLTASNLFGELGKYHTQKNLHKDVWIWMKLVSIFPFHETRFYLRACTARPGLFFPDERCEHIEWRSPTESWLRRSRPSLPDHPRGSKPQSSMGIYGSGVNSYNRVHLQPSLSVFILPWELYSESLLVFIYQSLIKGRKCHHFQSWLIFQVLIS